MGRIYVDGKLDGKGIWDYPIGAAEASLAFDAALKKYFRGSLDEVAIYDRALTPAQIRTHFAASGRALAPDRDIGSLRARVAGTQVRSLAFSLVRPPDRYVLPFGG